MFGGLRGIAAIFQAPSLDGDNWQVRAPGIEVEIPEGAEVSVTAYDSIILTVADPSKTKPLKKQ